MLFGLKRRSNGLGVGNSDKDEACELAYRGLQSVLAQETESAVCFASNFRNARVKGQEPKKRIMTLDPGSLSR